MTQRHIARGAYDNQRTSIVSMAAMLAAIVLGAATDMSGDAMTGIVSASQGHGRSTADQLHARATSTKRTASAWSCSRARASIRTACRASSRSSAAATAARRSTCPSCCALTRSASERVAEARDRARQLPQTTHTSSPAYALAKARLIALNAPTPEAAFAVFRDKVGSDVAGRPLRARARLDAHVAARQRRSAVPRADRGLSERRWRFASAKPKRWPRAARRSRRSSSTRRRSGCSRATFR